jgi:hypothetical protein
VKYASISKRSSIEKTKKENLKGKGFLGRKGVDNSCKHSVEKAGQHVYRHTGLRRNSAFVER